MYRILLIYALVGLCSAKCSFPNGTETAVNWWQGATTAKMTFTSLQPVDANGDSLYPIPLSKPLLVSTHLDNEQGVFSSPNLKMDITLYEYGGLIGCTWSVVPTFGLLSNLDACSSGIPCPVQTGEQDMTVTLDFTKYESIISLLTNDSPYQVQLKLTDKISKTYVTIVVQARCLTK